MSEVSKPFHSDEDKRVYDNEYERIFGNSIDVEQRFSKPSGPLFEIKEDFFKKNSNLLEGALDTNGLYAEQEARECCKNCGDSVGEPDFESFHIPYSMCGTCGHLNGVYEDTDQFLDKLYSADDGDNYKENYLGSYDKRVESIYTPKVQFLKDVVGECVVYDVGCGGGHFVKACENEGIQAVGVDPNKSLIELGKTKLDSNRIELCGANDFEEFIEGAESVVSMIGVLEHLKEPGRAIEAFNRSKAEYLYISVPLFSLSVFIEHAFEDVFPRHLSKAHTHLYTPESLEYMAKKYNLETIGEWWFGSDMMDLYRSLIVTSEGSDQFRGKLGAVLGDHIDRLQTVLDENKMCSEVHLILKKK